MIKAKIVSYSREVTEVATYQYENYKDMNDHVSMMEKIGWTSRKHSEHPIATFSKVFNQIRKDW